VTDLRRLLLRLM